MNVFKKYRCDITPYIFIVFLIVWTLFIYVIGSMHYECECKLAQCVMEKEEFVHVYLNSSTQINNIIDENGYYIGNK